MIAALETFGLGKSYGHGTRTVSALGALDLSIPKGLVYGVLGPNGAGKSTLLRLALGLIQPSRGSVRLLGEQAIDARVLRRVGAMIEAPALYPFLTARETMRVFARYSGLHDPAREQEVLERVPSVDHPQYGRHIELGVKGPAPLVPAAWQDLKRGLHEFGANCGPELVRNL